MKRFACVTVFLFAVVASGLSAKPEFYEIKIYHIRNKDQEARVEKFLKDAFVPAAHRVGISKVGIFKPLNTDSLAGKRLIVLIAFPDATQITAFYRKLGKDAAYEAAGNDYLTASYENPPYTRIETIQLVAFEGMPLSEIPKLTSPPEQRVYELRSYESATEKLYKNKVQMFNQGDEIGLFKRLGFNAVFYAEVISGSHMPNLMYMTSFENLASRDAHWKTFVDDPEWKRLSSLPEYQHNVSHADIYLLQSTTYSDF